MQLSREIGLPAATLLVVGNIIGTGIFTVSGFIVAELGPTPWLLGVWALVGGMALIGATCYSLLSVQNPRAGGEYALLYPSFGPLPAFLAGWASLLIGFSAPIAAGALGLAEYALSFFTASAANQQWTLKIIALVTLLLVSLLLSLGLKLGASFHSVLTLFNLALVLGFSVLVLAGSSPARNLTAALSPASSFTWPALASAVVMVAFAYSGWNAAVYVAEEIRRPQQNIPGALLLGTLTVVVVYLLVNTAYFSAVPAAALKNQVAVAAIAADATLGVHARSLVNVLILVSILTAITAMSIAGPRVYFAMSRDGLFPAWLTHVDPRRKVPVRSLWFQTLIASGLVLVATLREILFWAGAVLILFTTLTVATMFTLRQRDHDALRFLLLYRLLPAVFIAANTAVLALAAHSRPREAGWGILVLALGLPVYFYYRARAES